MLRAFGFICSRVSKIDKSRVFRCMLEVHCAEKSAFAASNSIEGYILFKQIKRAQGRMVCALEMKI
jgi:hypothetical protein